jgi:hypothetical protein
VKQFVRLAILSLCLSSLSPAFAQAEPEPQGILGAPVFDTPEAKPKTDAEIRQWYVDRVATIPTQNAKWLTEGLGAEARARRAYTIRHDARIEARGMMQSKTAVIALRARDRIKYGNPNGPTFDYLVKKNQAKGLKGDAVYEAIVGSAKRTNRRVNERNGVAEAG